MGHDRRRARGLTLIELMVSAALLSLATLTLVASLLSSQKLDTITQERLWARQECRRQLEAILAMPFPNVAMKHGTTFAVEVDANGDGTIQPRERLKGATQALPGLITVDKTAAGDWVVHRVTATASWKTRTGTGRNATNDVATVSLSVNVGEH